MKDNLSYLFSLLQFIGKNPGVKDLTPQMEHEILKNQPKWQLYLKEQGETLKRAIIVFKNYDKTGELNKFFENFETIKSNFSDKIFLNLMECAKEAYDQGVLQDAFLMFSFITTYYPLQYRVYIYLGKIVQELYGSAEASTFYKTTTQLFPEAELLFIAAECEMQQDNTTEAKNYLEKAQKTLTQKGDLTEFDTELKTRVDELLKLIQQL